MRHEDGMNIRHYFIVAINDCIDVLSDLPPRGQWIGPAGRTMT